MEKLACGTRGCWPILVTTTEKPKMETTEKVTEKVILLEVDLRDIIIVVLIVLSIVAVMLSCKLWKNHKTSEATTENAPEVIIRNNL